MQKFLAIAALATLVACGSSDSSTAVSSDVNVAGTYTLRTINGSALPFTTSGTATPRSDVISSTYTLGSAAFSDVVVTRLTSATGSTTTSSTTFNGTYSAEPGVVHFVDRSTATPRSYDMTLTNSNTLTLTESGFVYVYQR